MENDSSGNTITSLVPHKTNESLAADTSFSGTYGTVIASSCGAYEESGHYWSNTSGTSGTLPYKHRRKDDKAKDIFSPDEGAMDSQRGSSSDDGSFFSAEEIEEEEPDVEKPIFTPIAPMPINDVLKLSPELRHAYRICRELMSDQYRSINEPFYYPVNPVELGLFDYYDRIKNPMALSTIHSKFTSEMYSSITEVVADVRLVLENCYKYNGIAHQVSKKAEKLEQVLEQKLALLSRVLREKTTLMATNALQEKSHLNAIIQSGSRRRSSRLGNEGESPIMMQIKLAEECEEKSRKKQKEKERKDAVEAKINDLQEWDDKVLTPELLHEISTTWEIPSVGLFLCILKDFFNLSEFNYTEFELGILFPNKSSLIAKVFTSLLVTQFQRQRLSKKNPMDYRSWSSKVKGKLQTWYKMAESRGKLYASSLWGFDIELFHVLGPKMPLEDQTFHELTIKQRMWILKAFCENCLEEDSDMKEHLAKLEMLDRQDLNLGQDADKFSYHYFPQFGSSDIRVYKQVINTIPTIPVNDNDSLLDVNGNGDETNDERKEQVTPKGKKKKKKGDTEESSKKSLNASKAPEDAMSFELVAWDVQSLRELTGSFADQPKRRGVKYVPRKPCVIDLHQTLEAILEEVSKREAGFTKSMQKAKLKIMDEYEAPDPPENPVGDGPTIKGQDWDSECEDENDSEFDKKSVQEGDKPLMNGAVTVKEEPAEPEVNCLNGDVAYPDDSLKPQKLEDTSEESMQCYTVEANGRMLRKTRQRTTKSTAYKEQLDQNRKQQKKKAPKQHSNIPEEATEPVSSLSDNPYGKLNGAKSRKDQRSNNHSNKGRSRPKQQIVKNGDEPVAKKRRKQQDDTQKSSQKISNPKMMKNGPSAVGNNFVFDGLRALADIASLTQRQEGLVQHPSQGDDQKGNHEGLPSAMLSAKASKLNLSSVLKCEAEQDSEKRPLTVTVVSSRGQEERNVALRKWSRPNILSSKAPRGSGKSNVKIVAPSTQAKEGRVRQVKSKGSGKKEQNIDLSTSFVMSQLPPKQSQGQDSSLSSTTPVTSLQFKGQKSVTITPNITAQTAARKTCVATTVWPVQVKAPVSKPPVSVMKDTTVFKAIKPAPVRISNPNNVKAVPNMPGVGLRFASPMVPKQGQTVIGPKETSIQSQLNPAVISQLLSVATGPSNQVTNHNPLVTIPRVVAQIPTLSVKEINSRSSMYSGMQTVTAAGTGSVATVHVHVLNPKIAQKQQPSEKSADVSNQKGPIAILPKGHENLVDRAGAVNSRETLLEQVHQILRTRGITLPKPRREVREPPHVGTFKTSVGANYDLETALSVVRSSMSAPKSTSNTPSTPESIVSSQAYKMGDSTHGAQSTNNPSLNVGGTAVTMSMSSQPPPLALISTGKTHTALKTISSATRPQPIPIAPIMTGSTTSITPKVALAPIKPANKTAYKFPVNFKAKAMSDSKLPTDIQQPQLAPNTALNKTTVVPQTMLLPSNTISDGAIGAGMKQGAAVGGQLNPQQGHPSKYMAIQVVSPSSTAGALVAPIQQRLPTMSNVQTIQVIPSYASVGNMIKPASASTVTVATVTVPTASAAHVSDLTVPKAKLQPVAPLAGYSEAVAHQVLLPAGIRPVALQPIHLVPSGVPQTLIPVPVLASSTPVTETRKMGAITSSPVETTPSANRPMDKTSMQSSCSKKSDIHHEGVDPAECDMFGHWRTIMCKSSKRYKSENVLIDVSSRSKAAKLISDIRKGSSSKQSATESNSERTPPLFCSERLSPSQESHGFNKSSSTPVAVSKVAIQQSPSPAGTPCHSRFASLSTAKPDQPESNHSSFSSLSPDTRLNFSTRNSFDESCDDITAQPLPDPGQLTKSITSLNTTTHLSALDRGSFSDDTGTYNSDDILSERNSPTKLATFNLQPGISSKVRRLLNASIAKSSSNSVTKKDKTEAPDTEELSTKTHESAAKTPERSRLSSQDKEESLTLMPQETCENGKETVTSTIVRDPDGSQSSSENVESSSNSDICSRHINGSNSESVSSSEQSISVDNSNKADTTAVAADKIESGSKRTYQNESQDSTTAPDVSDRKKPKL